MKTPKLEIEVQFDAPWEYNTLAIDPRTHEFFLARGSLGEIDLASVKPVSVRAGLEWFVQAETLACQSQDSVGSDGMPVELCRAAAAIIADLMP